MKGMVCPKATKMEETGQGNGTLKAKGGGWRNKQCLVVEGLQRHVKERKAFEGL